MVFIDKKAKFNLEEESEAFKAYFPEWDDNCFVDPHQVLLEMAVQMKLLTQRHLSC